MTSGMSSFQTLAVEKRGIRGRFSSLKSLLSWMILSRIGL